MPIQTTSFDAGNAVAYTYLISGVHYTILPGVAISSDFGWNASWTNGFGQEYIENQGAVSGGTAISHDTDQNIAWYGATGSLLASSGFGPPTRATR